MRDIREIGILTIAQEVADRNRNPYPFGLIRGAADRFAVSIHTCGWSAYGVPLLSHTLRHSC